MKTAKGVVGRMGGSLKIEKLQLCETVGSPEVVR